MLVSKQNRYTYPIHLGFFVLDGEDTNNLAEFTKDFAQILFARVVRKVGDADGETLEATSLGHTERAGCSRSITSSQGGRNITATGAWVDGWQKNLVDKESKLA